MSENYNIPKEHMTDPRYGYVLNGGFLLSKWVRENVTPSEHVFKVGDVVTVSITTEIEALQRDVDGSALYKLSKLGGGWNADNIRLATKEESDNY